MRARTFRGAAAGLFVVIVLIVGWLKVRAQPTPPAHSGPIVKPGTMVVPSVSLTLSSVERTTTPAGVLDPPPVSVLYVGTGAFANFTLVNNTGQAIDGRVVGNFGGAIFPVGNTISRLSPGRSVSSHVDLGVPAAGQTTAFVYFQQMASPSSGWITRRNAYVTVALRPAPTHVARAPYDLVWDEVDDNGFPKNPRWAAQDDYFWRTGSRDLAGPDARPNIHGSCFDHAEAQAPNTATLNNGYPPFENGYCKHSPGATWFPDEYCHSDRPDPSIVQPGGPIYCASFSWMDNPWAGKCGMDDATGAAYLYPFHVSGHINFAVATYDGVVRWDNAQHESMAESDWCINLYTPHGAGVTGLKDGRTQSEFEPWVHMEFDPLNIGDDFDRGFWGKFRDNVHGGQHLWSAACGVGYCQSTADDQNRTSAQGVAPMINGRRAIAIGLVGIDVGHSDAGGELHPLFGLAVHTGGAYDPSTHTMTKGGRPRRSAECNFDNPAWPGHCAFDNDAFRYPASRAEDPEFDVPIDPSDDVWAIWATNFGNEGYCSTRALHVLDGDESIIGQRSFSTMTFRIPWAKDRHGQDMKDVAILPEPLTSFVQHAQVDIGQNQEKWDWAIDRGERKGVIITFHLWPSATRPVWFGELHLKWTPGPPPQLTAPAVGPITGVRYSPTAHMKAAEEHPSAIGMSAAQKKVFAQATNTRAPIAAPVVRKAMIGIAQEVQPPPPKPLLTSVPRIVPHLERAALSPGAAEEDEAVRRALCAAYAGKLPKLPKDLCRRRPPR